MTQSLRQGTDILEFPSGRAGCMLSPAMSGAFRVVPIECDLIVSLGTNCELAYNLRHFYGIERTGLFDWLITPLGCLPDLIRRRFALVDDDFADALVRVDLPNNDSIMHAPTGILLHHAFTRDERDRISPHWRSELDAVAAKFRFLGERTDDWLSASVRPALFVNKAGRHDVLNSDQIGKLSAPDAHEMIIDAICDTYPFANPIFCITNPEYSVDRIRHRQDVRVAAVGNRGGWHEGIDGHFAGCKSSWEDALSNLLKRSCRKQYAIA